MRAYFAVLFAVASVAGLLAGAALAYQSGPRDEPSTRELVDPLNHFDTRLCLRAEREFLRLLHADCNQPVGVLATMKGKVMKIRAQIFDLGATTPDEATIEGPIEDAEQLAAQLFKKIHGEEK